MKVMLYGGTHDGERHEVYHWQRIIYIPKKLTKAESDTLKIDEIHAWRPPDEVYERTEDGKYFLRNIVVYKAEV